MIEAVFVFGAMNVLFEFVLLSFLGPRMRLRLLGSHGACVAMHFLFLSLNLLIHWGTLVGTMSGIGAFISSIVTIGFAKKLFGFIEANRFYHVGWMKYSTEELK